MSIAEIPHVDEKSGTRLCTRCGVRFQPAATNKLGVCPSCKEVDVKPPRQRRYREVTTNVPGAPGRCWAWMGDFDDDDNPIDAGGFAVIAGERRCRHRDCVNPAHIDEAVLFA